MDPTIIQRVSLLRQRAACLCSAGGIEPPPFRLPPLDADSPLGRVVGRLRLGELEAALVTVLFAVEVEPFFAVALRTLQRGTRPLIELGTAANLLGLPNDRLAELIALLHPERALVAEGLIEIEDTSVPAGSLQLRLEAGLVRHLVGDPRPSEGLVVVDSKLGLDDVLAAPEVVRALLLRMQRAYAEDQPLTVELVGAPGTGKLRLAEVLSSMLGRPLLVLDLARVEERQLGRQLKVAARDARILGALLCLQHLDAHVVAARAEDAQMVAPPHLPRALADFLARPAVIALTADEDHATLLAEHTSSLTVVQAPFPTAAERARLIDQGLMRAGVERREDLAIDSLARQMALDPRRIASVIREAGALGPIGRAELATVCRAHLRHDLSRVCERVTNNHRWEDMVVPSEVYDTMLEMASYVRHSRRVFDDWGFGSRHSLTEGVSALFAGPPGTGKTMCASVIARELGMELFRVDVSRVVSKWVGETEKNLSRVFDEAQRSNAIILFDEADALFAKRTGVSSAQDRYANQEVNYLLQRVERFGGVLILTTNFEDTIDAAFKRRLTFRVRFERPDEEARALLWTKAFPSSCALAADVDPAELGRLVELSGGNIRNAAVRAAFLAATRERPIDQATCREAALREASEMGMLAYASLEPDHAPKVESRAFERAAPTPLPAPRIVRPIPITNPRHQTRRGGTP